MLTHSHKMLCIILNISFFLALLVILPAEASKKTTAIDWDDLIPQMPELENPFSSLSSEQLMDLEYLILTRNDGQQFSTFSVGEEVPGSTVSEAFEYEVEIRYKLEKQGLDLDALIAAYDVLEEKISRRNKMTNKDLDNKLVKIPGYALPLEHQDTGIKELLLVPYVGACIHVPPPPENQTIYVKLKEASTFEDIYEPVWITGRLSIKATNQTLSLVDGSGIVDTGYTLEGIKVEPYREE